MEQAISAYCKVTASPEFREVERMREKARHDEAQALHHAKMEERAEAALRMLASGKLSLEEVANFSGLPVEEIKKLQKERLS